MKIIGLTGSIAMGKSEAAKYFAKAGFPVFDADAEVHKLYDSPQGAALLRPFLPQATLAERVDRSIVTQAIMADPALLTKLEGIVHAEIRKRRDAFIASARRSGAAAVILDIPLLFETGAEKDLDATIVISSHATVQEQRALLRPGMTRERLELILSRQMPDAVKRAKATYCVENNSTIAELHNSLARIVEKLDLKHHA